MTPCDSCHAGCCRSFAVPLSGADILRMERELGLTFWQFACRWADPAGRIARNHAPHFHFEDEPDTPFVICLLQRPSTFFPQTRKCRFLMECEPDADHPLGRARCGIYDRRPAACRAFPAKMDELGQLAVIYEVPERGRPGDEPLYELCPRPWTPEDFDPLTTPQELVVAAYEMAFFHQLARMWNRRPQAWEAFPDFLRLVYAQRVVCEKPADASHDDAVHVMPARPPVYRKAA